MRDCSEMVLKAYLSRVPLERRVALERFLPEERRLRLEKLPPFPEEATPEEMGEGSMLEKVHWSWFLPTLKTYPAREQRLFVSSLGGAAAKSLAHELAPEESWGTVEGISEMAKGFFRQILLHSLLGAKEWVLPLGYLPLSSLKPLLSLSKKELTRLIDFLSLHDLAFELRQIVETKILKKIYSLLSEEERKFLKHLLANQKEPFAIARMGLDRWDGTEESFHLSLHRRGIARLAVALSGQDPDLIWYICHQLDIGRGTALYKQCAKEPAAGLSVAVIRQIEEILARENGL